MSTPTTAKSPTAFGRLLESPRAQRRALIAGLAIFAIGAGAFVFAFFRNTGHNLNTPTYGKAQLVQKEPTVAIDPAIVTVAKKFILTAVTRQHVDQAYDIVSTDLRGSLTRKQWATGEIPVVPYPAADVANLRYSIDYSHPTQAGIEVGLHPTAGHPGVRVLTFFVGLKKIGTGANARWVVNYWAPRYHPPVPKTP